MSKTDLYAQHGEAFKALADEEDAIVGESIDWRLRAHGDYSNFSGRIGI
jgi:hypothetical protein